MHPDDAKEITRGTRTVGYHEWVDVPAGLVYQSCCDCGLAHSIMIALPSKDDIPESELRVRFMSEPELTEATRDSEKLDIPLYREVKRLREENLQLRKDKEALLLLSATCGQIIHRAEQHVDESILYKEL